MPIVFCSTLSISISDWLFGFDLGIPHWVCILSLVCYLWWNFVNWNWDFLINFNAIECFFHLGLWLLNATVENMQSQLVCNGCRTVLLYPRGAPNVRCAVCNTVTPVQPAGTSSSRVFFMDFFTRGLGERDLLEERTLQWNGIKPHSTYLFVYVWVNSKTGFEFCS